MKTIAGLALSLVFLGVSSSMAAPKGNSSRTSLAAVPAGELPGKAADLVKSAKAGERRAVTADVVTAAEDLNPAATPQVVGAIAHAEPDMAALAAGMAAAQLPKQASVIARAAAAAAPRQANKIVAAVCRAVPNDYRAVAVAVDSAVPGQSKAVLLGVADALPSLRPGIQAAVASNRGNALSVAMVLDSVKPSEVARTTAQVPATMTPAEPALGKQPIAPSAPASGPRPPAVGPPYIPLANTPTNVSAGTSGDVPSGGRNYAAP